MLPLISGLIPIASKYCLVTALGAVSGYSERVEDMLVAMETIKGGEHSDRLSEDEVKNKAREMLIQKGIDIAKDKIRKKGSNLV